MSWRGEKTARPQFSVIDHIWLGLRVANEKLDDLVINVFIRPPASLEH